MRLPNLQKARFCRQNCEIHGNLGGQEPGTKKNNLDIFYLKKCACPTSKKARFCSQNCDIHGNLGGQEPGTKTHANKIVKFMENLGGQEPGTKKKQFEYLLFEKMGLPNLQITRFCRQNCEIHGNLGGQEPGTKKNMNIFYLKKCACPTSKKLDFADKIVKFMEI